MRLQDLRQLLQGDIPAAAAVIRGITGPITIREELTPGRNHGARWIARFSPQYQEILRFLTKDEGRVDSAVQGCDLGAKQIEVVIEKVPRYMQLADKFHQLHLEGVSISAMAAAHGMTNVAAREILKYATTGQRTKSPSRKPTGTGQRKIYVEIAEQVVQLRDRKTSFRKIAESLSVDEATARRAYDYARPQAVRKSIEQHTKPQRGRYSHLSPETFLKIQKLLREGKNAKQIAELANCGLSTVHRVRNEMQSASNRDQIR